MQFKIGQNRKVKNENDKFSMHITGHDKHYFSSKQPVLLGGHSLFLPKESRMQTMHSFILFPNKVYYF